MLTFEIDCRGVGFEGEFWHRYVLAVKPQGAEFFGCNLAAFWDAVSAGGPGWPCPEGVDECEIRLLNSASLRACGDSFFDRLQAIARDSQYVVIRFD